jgi:hypothetical protein
MITPQFTVTVSDTALRLHFAKLPLNLRTNLQKTIQALTTELLGRVRAAEPVRTGLLRSQTRSYVDVTENYVRGRVRILATGHASRTGAAFGALEYGAHAAILVKAYQRRGGLVREYARVVNIAEQRFLRNSLDAMRAKATAELEAAVAKTVEEFNQS